MMLLEVIPTVTFPVVASFINLTMNLNNQISTARVTLLALRRGSESKGITSCLPNHSIYSAYMNADPNKTANNQIPKQMLAN